MTSKKADILELLDNYTVAELDEQIELYMTARKSKADWDKKSRDEKDAEWDATE